MARAFGSYPTGHRFKSYFRYHIWPGGQAVKTPPFHGGNTSSILVRVTRGSAIAEPLFLQNMKLTVRSGNHIQSDLPYPRSAIVFYGQRRFAALPVTVSAVLAKSLERAKGLRQHRIIADEDRRRTVAEQKSHSTSAYPL